MSVHDEKIDHAVSRLTDAGLSDDNPNNAIDDVDSRISSNKWIIIGSVIGGVVLLTAMTLALVYWRRYRKRKAYSIVHRGMDMPQPPGGPGMSGGLMPLWMQRSQQNQNGGPSTIATPPIDGTDSQRLRRYSTSGLPRSARESFSTRDVFDAEKEMGPNENDSLTVGGSKFRENEFGSAYDGVETGYGSGGPVDAGLGGDRRSQM